MTDQMRTYRSAAAGNIGPGFKPGFFPDSLWEDQNFDVLAITVPGGNNAPTAYTIPTKGLVLPSFPDGNDVTEAPGSKELAHAWEIGTSIYPHFHLRKLDDGAGDVYFGFEYEVLQGSTLLEGTLTKTFTVTDLTTLNEESIVAFDAIDLSTITDVGAQITFRLFRNPTDAADDFAGDVAVTTVGWHYLRDSSGSRSIASK